ncbi:hypothetical protein LAUMK142_04920 [Mycobacterium pseudokansasii]|uniref:Uncharacterized protein n=4 Tax=Mycobacteriaceae TaxID=1762 RepID=A0A498R0F3_9MYCO|nr:hypothetical protein LAUMK142_04920 [Mycobacterium pseudokansasii]
MRLLDDLSTSDAGHPQEALIGITDVICLDDTPNVMHDLRVASASGLPGGQAVRSLVRQNLRGACRLVGLPLPLMPNTVRINTASVQETTTGWSVLAAGTTAVMPPAITGLSCQPSAAAVSAADAMMSGFAAALSARITSYTGKVTAAVDGYTANEANSAAEMTAVAPVVMV